MKSQSDQFLDNTPSHRNIWGWFIIYLIWPFGALLKSFSWVRTKEAKNLFWLFCVYFGFTFVLKEGSFSDSARIARDLHEMSRSGISLNELLGTFYTTGSKNIDVIQSLITFIVSRFTDDARFLFAVFGLVFGYFYSRNIWLIMNKTNVHIGIFSGLVLLSFVFVDGIWNINGFRFNTAIQVFVYGSLSYFIEGNKRKLWITAAVVFLHWSFLIAFAILLIYIFIRNRSWIYFALFIISFFVASLQMDIVRNWFESYAPAMIQESRSGYLNEHVIEKRESMASTANWYVRGHVEIIKWFVFASIAYIYLKGINKIRKHKQLFNLFNFSLLFYAIVNILSSIPSVGRFYEVANMLSLAVIFLNLQMIPDNYSPWLKRIGIPFLLVFILVKLRFAFDYMGASLVFGNPISAFFIEHQTPLIEFVKSLL
jgi:hypothetical protein